MGMRVGVHGGFPDVPPSPYPIQWAGGPVQPWGFSADSAQLDAYTRNTAPADSAEVLRTWDVMRCVVIAPTDIVPGGVAFELVRFDAVPDSSVGVLERLPTQFENAQALTAAGVVQVTYSNVNGENPCLRRLVHPDDAVADLTWQWRVTVVGPDSSVVPIAGPMLPLAVPGRDLVQPWTDQRYGVSGRWGDDWQVIIPARSVVRVWLTLFGPTGRYAITAGARLAGYTQLAGRHGAALGAAIHRTH
jgi:hypothetical protein